jgi:DNA ligase-1
MTIKAMRAANYDPAKIKFPVWAEPKIDGVRGYNPDGILLARTMKKLKNKYTTEFFSGPDYIGFDGELAANHECHPDLCRLTSSAVGTIEGKPYVLWHIFDYVTEATRGLPYSRRKDILERKIRDLQANGKCGYLRVVPHIVCNNMAELTAAHEHFMELGYEGTCFYGPNVTHKEGKSSPTHNGVLRIKDFIDAEAVVLEIVEGETNNNEAQVNELGRTFRTSHQENKVSNGMVGSMTCKMLDDVYDLHDHTKLLLAKHQIITVSPGKMTEKDRIYYFQHQIGLIGQAIKFKFFPKGIKDKPRFPTFESIRLPEDM